MGKRTKARECAFQMIYQWEMSQEPVERVAEGFWRVRSSTEETRARADRLACGTLALLPQIDSAIQTATEHWRFERIAAVDRSILRLGTYELMREETPSAVVIDEAVELARRFGEADSPAFVNGVLDAVMRAVRGSGEAKRVRGA